MTPAALMASGIDTFVGVVWCSTLGRIEFECNQRPPLVRSITQHPGIALFDIASD